MARVLVTGGAGYIGSHVIRELLDQGHEPVVLDNLTRGHRVAAGPCRLVVGGVHDERILDPLLAEGRFDAVIHLAAFIEAGESVTNPVPYFWNNVGGTLQLLRCMLRHGPGVLVFSSTAAVYGDASEQPLVETSPIAPASPYGLSKWQSEQILRSAEAAGGPRVIVFRYFNAAGAHPEGSIGEDHEPETHLIPRACRAALTGGTFEIYGTDYPTRDGTCVRDYVHVCDLAAAHGAAVDALLAGAGGGAYNLGSECGYTVREVLSAVEAVAGAPLQVADRPRRPGDPARLVADARRARMELCWRPRWDDLESIVRSAWRWHREHPTGYGDRRLSEP